MYSSRLLATHSICIVPFHFPSRAYGVPPDFERAIPLYTAYNPRRDQVRKHVQFHCVFPSGECQMFKCGGSSKSLHTSFFFKIYLIRTSKTNYITFLYSHPALWCIFSHRPTNFLMPSAKYVIGWARSHWCTAAFTSSSHENRLAFLSGQKRWKSDGTKFGL